MHCDMGLNLCGKTAFCVTSQQELKQSNFRNCRWSIPGNDIYRNQPLIS